MNALKIKEQRCLVAWVIIGTILLVFSNGKWIVPISTWIAPIFIVRIYRTVKHQKGVIIPFICIILTAFISFKGVLNINGVKEYVILLLCAVIFFIPFLIDRKLYSKIGGFKATFILPLSAVVFDYLFSFINPFATWGSLAYTQFGNNSIVQIVSITGMWGITFILYWWYSFVNWFWENAYTINSIKKGTFIFVGVLILILLFGGFRNAFLKRSQTTVKIASITVPSKDIWRDVEPILDEKYSKYKKEELGIRLRNLDDELISETDREAKGGAKIIFWHEANGMVLKEDEDLFIKNIRRVAKENGVYVMMSVATINPGKKNIENKSIFIDYKGEVVFRYLKSKLTPNEKKFMVKGDGVIKYADTDYGRIGCAISYDMDSPSYIRQAGKHGIDILLVPGWDWKEIDPIHTKMAMLRSIENGFNTVRQANLGLSASTDSCGNILSHMDYFTGEETDNKILISYVPTKRTTTLYSYVGDWFPIVCILCFLRIAIFSRNMKQLKRDEKENLINLESKMINNKQ